MCQNNGIGYKGGIPWNIQEDLQYFSKLTKGKMPPANNAVIMGSHTWKSLPQGGMGLKGRDNLVLSQASQQFDIYVRGDYLIKTFPSVEAVERFITHSVKYDEVWVIGGAQVYEQFLSTNKIKKCYITYIDRAFECDTFFPALDMSQWTEVERRRDYNATYACAVDYVVYEKKAYWKILLQRHLFVRLRKNKFQKLSFTLGHLGHFVFNALGPHNH